MRLFSLLLLGALAAPASAQTARLQVIHNAADPAVATVDVYVNGARLLDDLDFREASPFIDVPAGVPLQVGVAPGTSTSASQAVLNAVYTLAPGSTAQLIAQGVVTPGSFAPNPNGRSTALELLANTSALEASAGPSTVAVRVVHGATDAPTVDVRVVGGVIVDDATYTDVAPVLLLPPAVYPLAITTGDGAFVAGFTADLTAAGGGAVTVLASGFLAPAANQNGPAFGLLAVFPDGTTALLPSRVIEARVQIIHNAPDPRVSTVDVYVNDALFVDDLDFRSATPFVNVPTGETFSVEIAPGNSTGVGDAVFGTAYTLPAGSTTQLIATGVLMGGTFAPNPDGVSNVFQLLVGADAQESSNDAATTAVRVVHGAPDAPTVDVRTGGTILVDDATYTDVTGYLQVAPQMYILDVTTASGSPVASFGVDLSGATGGAATVLASGFLNPAANQNGPAFGLLAVFPDGTTGLLPVGAEGSAPAAETLALGAPSPNPMRASGAVAFSLRSAGAATLALYDALGRRVAVLADGEFAADVHEARIPAGLASGVYVLRLQSADGAATRTLTVVR